MQSLGAKLFAVVFAILLINFGVVGTMNIRLHREHFETARLRSAARMTDLIRRSTSYSMLRNDRQTLEHVLTTLGHEQGIVRLRLTDDQGRVRFSTVRSEMGTIVPSLRLPPPVQESQVTRRGDERVLVVTTPIPNAPSCATAACHAHSEAQTVLGVLDVDLSLADADADVAHASWQFIGYSAIAILITLGAIGALVWHLVHEPVRALREATQRVGAGELGVQIPVDSRDELGELAESFNEMSRQLRKAKGLELQRAQDQMIHAEKLTSLGKLAAVVAHEINNPLSGILTYARLMRKWIERGDDLATHSGDMRDQLQLIESESRRCGEIVRNLLTFSRVAPLNLGEVDINAVVKQTLKLVDHHLELGNISQRLELADGLPRLHGDASQLEQLLLALVMNAIDAMPREGTLRIATRVNEGAVVIEVEDDGVGIPPDLLPRLFEPFVTTKSEEGKGVGLGLAISKSIVERHNGAISVQSEPGRGTKFTIALPAEKSSCPSEEAFSSSTTSPAFATV